MGKKINDTKNTAFCLNCHREVTYEIATYICERVVKDVSVSFEGKVATCEICGEEVWVGEVEKYNTLSARKAYCKKLELITPTQVDEILKKYKIGAKPLSKLLGWGEITILRFLNGCIPTKLYSDKLLELLDSEEKFYALAEQNKDRITPGAYKRILKARKTMSGAIINSPRVEPDMTTVVDNEVCLSTKTESMSHPINASAAGSNGVSTSATFCIGDVSMQK